MGFRKKSKMNNPLQTAHNDRTQRNGVDTMDTIALILTIVGAINWGLVGLAKFDLVAWIFGGQTAVISRIIYALVGLAGLWCITFLFRKRNEG